MGMKDWLDFSVTSVTVGNNCNILGEIKVETTVVRISKILDERLNDLAAKTGRRKSYYATKAIERYLEDLEDYHDAKEALKKSKRTYTLDEAARKLGLDY